MKNEIRGILPVGAPWGGPESIRFVSCSSSLYMHLKQPNRHEEQLFCSRSEKLCDRCGRCGNYDWSRKMHEQVYFELLTLSGLNCRTHWDPEFRPQFLTDLLLEAEDDEPIVRAMSFAGFEYRIVESVPPEVMHREIMEAVNRGVPVPAFRAAGDDWCLITGYDKDGEAVSGFYVPHDWDSAESRPDTLEERAFTRKNWVRPGTRLLIITGECPARVPDSEEFSYLRNLLVEPDGRECVSGLAAFDHCIELLRDEAFFASADADTLQRCYVHLHGFIGLLAESRCFAAFAFFSGMFGKLRDPDLAELSRKIGSLFMDTHNSCWKAWAAFGKDHTCRPERYAGSLRSRQVRLETIGILKELKQNDWNAIRLLEAMENISDPI
ncbi:MAG: hypothetical protein HPZ91_11595 [Lentisphaeria bacterium]|nr:hypothetical protein [Lentisphaeria bacterium]